MNLSGLIDTLGTQVEAAIKIGASQPAVCSWRSGKAFPRGLYLRALAQATGRTLAEVEAIVAAARAARMVAPSADASSMVQVPCTDPDAAPAGVAQ